MSVTNDEHKQPSETSELTKSEINQTTEAVIYTPSPKLDWEQTLDLLYKRFPDCFVTGREKKPLMIGLFNALVENLKDHPLSKKLLRKFIKFYVSKPSYYYAFKEGVMRIDLDGNPTEAVTAEQIEHAKEQLKSFYAKNKKRQQSKETKKSEASLAEIIKNNEEEIKSLLEDENVQLTKISKKNILSLKKDNKKKEQNK